AKPLLAGHATIKRGLTFSLDLLQDRHRLIAPHEDVVRIKMARNSGTGRLPVPNCLHLGGPVMLAIPIGSRKCRRESSRQENPRRASDSPRCSAFACQQAPVTRPESFVRSRGIVVCTSVLARALAGLRAQGASKSSA